MRYCRVDGSLDFEAKDDPFDQKNNKSMQLIQWFAYPNRKDLGFMTLSPGSGWRGSRAFANHRRYRKLISANVISLTLGPPDGGLGTATGESV